MADDNTIGNCQKDLVVTEETDDEIAELCASLHIPDNVSKLATAFWCELKRTKLPQFQSDAVCWYICLIYISSIDTRLPYGVNDPQSGSLERTCVTVTDLLKAADINILEFFRRLSVIGENGQMSDAVLHHQLMLERKYCITCPLLHKFDRIFADIFVQEEEGECSERVDEDAASRDGYEQRRTLCWLLFIYAKGSAMSGCLELVQSFHLLLCCIHFVMKSTPSFQLRPPFDFAKLEQSDSSDVMLKMLCDTYDGAGEEVQMMLATHLQPVVKSLLADSLSIEVENLQKLYLENYHRHGDIDETLFLCHDPQLVTLQGSSDRMSKISTVPPPVTPVRAAVNSILQLKSLLQSTPDQLSPSLTQYFMSCQVDPTAQIQSCISSLNSSFVRSFVGLMGAHNEQLAEQRFQLATRLYYRVMESLLKQESQRLQQNDFSHLLTNTVFHKCLLACAIEVVMATYRMPWNASVQGAAYTGMEGISFPWIITVFDIKAYDLIKVSESFIKAESSLSRDIIKHFQHIENLILESLAWKTGSPVFDQLARCEPTPHTLPVDSPKLDRSCVAQLYASPVRMPSGSATAGVPPLVTQSSPSTKRVRSASLNLFLNKVCRLAYHRLLSWCTLLAVPKDTQHSIWTCLEHCLTERADLMRDRHLDQIIMCCIYAVCKAVQHELKFKAIVAMYRSIPHTVPHVHTVYKEVLLDDGKRDSIIAFYNQIFMPSLRSHIMQLSTHSSVLSPNSRPSPLRLLTASPVFELSARRNFYISPMKSSPFRMPASPSNLTPNRRRLQCMFGDRPRSSEKLKEINSALKTASSPASSMPRSTDHTISRSAQKRMKFDDLDDAPCTDDGVQQFDTSIVVRRLPQPSPKSRKCLTFCDKTPEN